MSRGHAGLVVAGAFVVILFGSAVSAGAASGIVPEDFATIQAALDQSQAGDTIQVKDTSGPYFEKISFPRSGDAILGSISLEAFPGHTPVLDGTGVNGADMVLIDTRSYVRIRGFEIRNNLRVRDGSGVRVLGSGTDIQILDNTIHDIRGSDAMGITVYGTSTTESISELTISGNVIYDCEPARSEALTLNGNVELFLVEGNIVRDVNNIGIDFIGGETDINPDPTLVARNGICRFNEVYRARSIYGGGYGAGIYVDGGRDIVIENNIVSESDLGIEIGAENPGTDATGIIVRDNLIYRNDKVGIVFGGYSASVGRVRDCFFLNNTCFGNDTLGEGLGELWIQYAENNVVRNNIFSSTGQNVLVYSEAGNVGNELDYNLFFVPGGAAMSAEFVWRGTLYSGLTAYQAGSGQGANSLFVDPEFVDPVNDDLRIAPTSPAIDRGDPAFVAGWNEVDIDSEARIAGGRVDIGADEWQVSCASGDLGAVVGLRGVKEGSVEARFSWQPESSAIAYHLNSVTAKTSLVAPGPHRPAQGGVATGECEVTAPGVECVDPDARMVGDDVLFYQVLATCGIGGIEGPLE